MTLEEAETKAKDVASLIQGKEGVILKQSNPIAKTLAFPIEKRASGFLAVLEFQLEPEKLIEVKEFIAKDGKIVRDMILIKEPARIRKERRTRIKPVPAFETEQKVIEKDVSEPATKSAGKEKVELKDIEQKLDELLGE